MAWIVCCFVPWARIVNSLSKNTSPKFPQTLAAAAARQGIKAENKITKVIEDASLNLSDVITTRRSAIGWPDLALQPLERELHGKALLRWGSHWRSSVIFALLLEISEGKDQSGVFIVDKTSKPLQMLI